MGFFSEDMVSMLGVYEAETSELMGTIEDIVSRVEHEREFTDDDVAELFRCAHTVKGSSAMMGLDGLAELTHRVEDLFDLLRGDPAAAHDHIPDIIDHLYSFIDYVKDELVRMGDDGYSPADARSIIDQVSADVALLSGDDEGGNTAASPADEGAATDDEGAPGGAGSEAVEAKGAAGGEAAALDDSAAAPGGGNTETLASAGESAAEDAAGTALKVFFKQDVAMVNARALVIVKKLRNQVRVFSHLPGDLSSADAGRIIADDGLLIVVDAADVDKARKLLAKNSFVRRITVFDEAQAPAQAPDATQDKKAGGAATTDKFVTLRWDNMRDLQDMASEFLLHTSRLKALSDELPDQTELRSAVLHAARLVDDLVYRVNKMAMVSMSAMVPQLSRMVRDMCRSSGKQVTFDVTGGDIEIDRNLYNSISDPLLHIIRNAVDHGIEAPEERLTAGKEARGKVALSIENLGARVAFRVTDDGRGIDTDKVLAKAAKNGKLSKPAERYTRSEILQMVMMPGLSTSEEVTQYSGRGVGMDVVSTVVRDFNGHVDIASEPGAGTSITLYMPVAVTSVESLGFRIGETVYHMPLFNLSKIYVAEEVADCLATYEGSMLFTFKKREIPVLDMHRLLGCEGENAFYIVCHSMADEFVIGVDEVVGEFACANKPIPSCLGADWQAACPIRNVAIMDDGSVGYALNAALLASFAHGRLHAPEQADGEDGASAADGEGLSFELATPADVPKLAFVFTLGKERYAISIECVERLAPLPACAPTPRALPGLIGLVNYRSKAIPVFDLAASAGCQDESPYMLILSQDDGEHRGVAVSSAIGVHDLSHAVFAEEQPEPRAFAGGLRTAALLVEDPREPRVNLLVRY